jgi:hypothetical protein
MAIIQNWMLCITDPRFFVTKEAYFIFKSFFKKRTTYLLDSLSNYEGCFDIVYNFKEYSFQKSEKSNPGDIKQRLYTPRKNILHAFELQLLDINDTGSNFYTQQNLLGWPLYGVVYFRLKKYLHINKMVCCKILA